MNIILSKKEKHPTMQGEITQAINLDDKKVLFVYGLAGSRGDNLVSCSIPSDRFNTSVAAKGLTVYNIEDSGDGTPDVEGTVRAYWEREGFQVALVGISKNVRTSKNTAEYRLILADLHAAIFGA